jgi:hypothetical protein
MILATDVLAGLDDVAWGNLDHAYGTAVDVPDLCEPSAAATTRLAAMRS